MIKIEDKSLCCGCTACASICPHNAIRMVPDALGFKYPVVDQEKCVDCGLCEKVCAFNENYDRSMNLPEPLAVAVRHKAEEQVAGSMSGAAFVAMSDIVLEGGGVIYGAAMEGCTGVVHKRAEDASGRDEFRKSKYIQSDLGDIFRKVKEDLAEGRTVMFSGTPCQTAGLASYIGRKYRDNLYLVDIVCHGVPSPAVWKSYVEWNEKRAGAKAVDVLFRDKRFGWKSHKETLRLGEKTVHSESFAYMFYKHIMLRESCGVCHYTNLERPSDLTLADLWGWEKACPDFFPDNKGCSLVLCNTVKGKELMETMSDKVYSREVEISDLLQPNMQHPTELNEKRFDFERDYLEKGVGYVMRKYGNRGLRYVVEFTTWKAECIWRKWSRKALNMIKGNK